MKLIFLFLLLSTLASAQLPKCTEYVLYGPAGSVYAYKECGKHWTINDNAKGTAFIDSKLKAATTNFTTMDSLRTKAAKLVASWLILATSYNADAQTLLVKKYADVHIAPTLTSPTTISPGSGFECCGGDIYTPPGSTTAGGDIIVSGNFNGTPGGMSVRQWDGDATHRWRIVNAAGAVLGTPSAATPGHGFSVTDHANFVSLLGATVAEPLVVKGHFGVFFPASSAGANFAAINLVAKSTTAGSFQANSGNSGGAYYDTLRYIDCRSFNSGQEGLYEGFTSPNYAKCNYHYIKNFFVYNSTREGFQIKGVNNADVSYVTIVGAGQGHLASQDRGFQWDDSNGRFHHFVIYNAYEGAQIFSHGSRFDHGFISWSNNGAAANIFIGDTDAGAFDFPSSRLNGDTLIFENLCIRKEGTVAAAAFNVNLRNAPIMFRNNTLDNITAMYQDNRGASPPNTITGSVGNHGNVTGTCGTPLFAGSYNDPDNYAVQGLQTAASPWFDWGYRGIIHYP